MKNIVLFILSICATSTVFAQTFTDNGFNYIVISPTNVDIGKTLILSMRKTKQSNPFSKKPSSPKIVL